MIDTLKCLPIPAVLIAVAELIAPTIVLTLCQTLLFVGLAVFMRFPPALVATALAVAVPFNLFLFLVENLIFLMFPARLTNLGPGDFQSVGRQVVVLFVKVILLLIGAGIALGIGAVAYGLSNHSMIAFALVSAAVLIAETSALLPTLVYAFRKFDPSADTPPA